MPECSFDISWEHGAWANPLESATYGSLVIRLGGVPITEVRDDAARTTRQVVRVSVRLARLHAAFDAAPTMRERRAVMRDVELLEVEEMREFLRQMRKASFLF